MYFNDNFFATLLIHIFVIASHILFFILWLLLDEHILLSRDDKLLQLLEISMEQQQDQLEILQVILQEVQKTNKILTVKTLPISYRPSIEVILMLLISLVFFLFSLLMV